MTSIAHTASPRPRRLLAAVALPLLLLLGTVVMASPGAHGPNGEHLDAPAQTAAGGGGGAPRMEARSETFELVGHLRADEFSMLINRFETNEPVLDAKVEIETGALKAPARFHADMGDYAVDDGAFLMALRTPGEHAIVVTVIAGADADLLDGTLKSAGATGDEHAHGVPLTAWLLLALLALGAAIYFLNRRSTTPTGVAQ